MVFRTTLMLPCRHSGSPSCRVLRVMTKPRGLLRKNARRSHRAFVKRLNLSPEELRERIQEIKRSRDYSFLFQDDSQIPIIPSTSSLLRDVLLGSSRFGASVAAKKMDTDFCFTKNRVKKQGPTMSRMAVHQDCISKSPPKSLSQLSLKKTAHAYLENKVNVHLAPSGSLDKAVGKQGSVTLTTAKVVPGDSMKSSCLKRKQQVRIAAEKKINGGSDSLHKTMQKPANTSGMVKEDCLDGTGQGLAGSEKKVNADLGSSHKTVAGDSKKPGPLKIRFICGDRVFSKEIGLPKPPHHESVSSSISCA